MIKLMIFIISHSILTFGINIRKYCNKNVIDKYKGYKSLIWVELISSKLKLKSIIQKVNNRLYYYDLFFKKSKIYKDYYILYSIYMI
jgi:hypothetical protein